MVRAKLVLEDGTEFFGYFFTAPKIAFGEVVFSTGNVGYPESISDPSYAGQILILTSPLIGNYGISFQTNEYGIYKHLESKRAWIEGLIISSYTRQNHWSSDKTLADWLNDENKPGIEWIDTRALVKKIREHGVMMGAIAPADVDTYELLKKLKKLSYDRMMLVHKVSPDKPILHKVDKPKGRIVVVDCGIKYGILRELLKRGFEVLRIPCFLSPLDYIDGEKRVGILFSNGPGNPKLLTKTIEIARDVIQSGIPTMGICLGHQILALAEEEEIYKLKYGHRGQNKPVIDLKTDRSFVTTQNHGYVVKRNLRKYDLWMVNVDDGTVEAIFHKCKPVIGIQFHPEASPGPEDSTWIFDYFSKKIGRGG